MLEPYGVYLHIPWCKSRCPYCAFNTYVEPTPPFAAYTEALIRQWEALALLFPGPPDTLFFGGGTPSLHPPELVARLIGALAPRPGAEVTLEANPGTLHEGLLSELLRAGVNRLSVGVQTFNPAIARLLNRGHTVRQSRELMEEVGRAGFESWSLDLIFAVPGQSLDDLRRDLEQALALSPPHLSIYGLTAEPGTPYTRAVEEGRLSPPEEELWEEMYLLLTEALEGAGLVRYEISNFAREGHRCRHNEHYFRGRRYAGLGAGAHGWLPDGTRTVGHTSPAALIHSPTTWESAELPELRDQAVELLLSTLRHVDGVPLEGLRGLGFRLDPGALSRLERAELLRADPQQLRLSGRGWRLADAALRALSEALRPL